MAAIDFKWGKHKVRSDATTSVTASAGSVYLLSNTATVAVTLPTPVDGSFLIIKDTSGNRTANAITITPSSGNIEGDSNYIIQSDYESVTLVSDSTNWYII